MTEREKMLSGQLYNCGDPELLNQWHKARNLTRDYSLVDSVNLEEKDRIRNFQPPVDGEEIMRIFDLQPCREIGSLKSSIKDAILDGIIPNEHDAALEHMLKKAKSMGLTPKNL